MPISWLNHKPHAIAVYASWPALPSAHATLATGRPATALPGPVLHRLDCTSFCWRLRKSGWPKTVIPYRLPELIAGPATEPIWVCEGEKDADNVAGLGLIATTNPGGAAKWQPELAHWFKDKHLVYILEDNDDAGRTHTGKIMSALRGIVS